MTCSRCGENERFYKNHSWCKPCIAASSREFNRERRAADPLGTSRRNKANMLRYKYGITIERYEEMLREQGGRCAICETEIPGGPKNVFAVDHDHASGKVRGLLCSSCNLALGMLGDTLTNLRKAVNYLENN